MQSKLTKGHGLDIAPCRWHQ